MAQAAARPTRRFATVLAACLGALCATLPAAQPEEGVWHSDLWGQSGERWTPTGRLPDFSHAGYQRGEHPLPERKATTSVADFGAVGDGVTDDTEAFLRALREAAGETIRVPAGTYLIRDILDISRSSTVLQGEGSQRTRLRMTTPLNEIQPNWGATTGGRRTSNYSWSGGFIHVHGSLARETLAEVTAAAARGDHELAVSSVSSFTVGDEVRLVMRDAADRSLRSATTQRRPNRMQINE